MIKVIREEVRLDNTCPCHWWWEVTSTFPKVELGYISWRYSSESDILACVDEYLWVEMNTCKLRWILASWDDIKRQISTWQWCGRCQGVEGRVGTGSRRLGCLSVFGECVFICTLCNQSNLETSDNKEPLATTSLVPFHQDFGWPDIPRAKEILIACIR